MNLCRVHVQMLADALSASSIHDTEEGRSLLRYLLHALDTNRADPMFVQVFPADGKGGATT